MRKQYQRSDAYAPGIGELAARKETEMRKRAYECGLTAAERRELFNQLTTAEADLQAHADRLRETAEELRRGTIHPVHAANRITKIANDIARRKP